MIFTWWFCCARKRWHDSTPLLKDDEWAHSRHRWWRTWQEKQSCYLCICHNSSLIDKRPCNSSLFTADSSFRLRPLCYRRWFEQPWHRRTRSCKCTDAQAVSCAHNYTQRQGLRRKAENPDPGQVIIHLCVSCFMVCLFNRNCWSACLCGSTNAKTVEIFF